MGNHHAYGAADPFHAPETRTAAMPAIMELQRKHLEPSLFQPKGRQMVGGAIEKTTITEDRVQTHKVGGWDDVVGKPIGGDKGDRAAMWRIALAVAAVGFGAWIASAACYVAFALLTGAGR